MVYLSKTLTGLITAALLSQTITAHPGHDMETEIAARSAYFKNSARDLSHCSEKLKKRGTEDRQLKRRQTAIENLRQERGLHHKRKVDARSLDSVTNTSHLSDLDVTSDTTSSGHWGVEDIIYSNSSCILSPEGEIGPFYVTGEFIRRDVRETQEGIDIIVDGQFIDVNTCEPIPNLMWDMWHANSSGVYGGVIGSGNGNEADTGNLNNTFLRGLQPTDGDGVAQFISKFPGHYAGRATHIHVVGHLNGTVLSNGTYTGGNIAHIGQLFFDQDLITEVNLIEPYVNNTIAITENVDDRVVAVEVDNDADPFFNYVLLGDTVSDGLFMWITLGVDPTAAYTYSAASEYTASGGIELSSSTSPDGNSTSNTTTVI